MIIPIEVTVSTACEAEVMDLARINLTEEKIAWLKKMSRIVRRNDIAYLADYDSVPEYFVRDDEDDEDDTRNATKYDYSVDCEMIVVKKWGFYWKGMFKGTSDHYETDSISFKDLNKLIRFYKNTPDNKLPKYINDKDYELREIALRRMKGDKAMVQT